MNVVYRREAGTAPPMPPCVRSGQCSYLHAELFDRDSEDFPASTVGHPGEEHRAAIKDAMELCPTSSISLMEDGG